MRPIRDIDEAYSPKQRCSIRCHGLGGLWSSSDAKLLAIIRRQTVWNDFEIGHKYSPHALIVAKEALAEFIISIWACVPITSCQNVLQFRFTFITLFDPLRKLRFSIHIYIFSVDLFSMKLRWIWTLVYRFIFIVLFLQMNKYFVYSTTLAASN